MTLKNRCVFVWLCGCVVVCVDDMSLPEGKLEGGMFPEMSVRGD